MDTDTETNTPTRTPMRRTEGMIDLTLDYHAHVLPGCDHGSDGVETSRKQLAMAAAAGIRTVCATPHFYPHKESIPSFLQRRAESARLLRESLTADAPQLRLGAEVLICDGMERLDGLSRLCREETDELLLEMPFYRSGARRPVSAGGYRATDRRRRAVTAQCGMPDKAAPAQAISFVDRKRRGAVSGQRYPYAREGLPRS